jgi:hypothetical protein
MNSSLLALTLAATLAAGAGQPGKNTPRERNPFAPSLPLLTDEEEAKLDEIIGRFIQFDSGQLGSLDADKARRDFEKLGPEAIPALIRGLNEAAKIDYSCPAVTIAKKLGRMLEASRDRELLQFARENIGAGVTRSLHMRVLRDLRVACMLRQNQLARLGITAETPPEEPSLDGRLTEPPHSSLRTLGATELAELAGKERGPRLKAVVRELGRRTDDEAVAALGVAAASYEEDVRALARDMLVSNLSKQSASAVKARLTDEKAEVRAAAARVAGKKFPALGGAVIDLLQDDDRGVREAAHEALVRLDHGTDLGPDAKADADGRAAAVERWRAWWAKQGGR